MTSRKGWDCGISLFLSVFSSPYYRTYDEWYDTSGRPPMRFFSYVFLRTSATVIRSLHPFPLWYMKNYSQPQQQLSSVVCARVESLCVACACMHARVCDGMCARVVLVCTAVVV